MPVIVLPVTRVRGMIDIDYCSCGLGSRKKDGPSKLFLLTVNINLVVHVNNEKSDDRRCGLMNHRTKSYGDEIDSPTR